MSLCIRARFIVGTYSGHAGAGSPWPPAPARVVSAAVAEAHRSARLTVRDILQDLCRAGNPTIVAPAAFSSGEASSYMQPQGATLSGKVSKSEVKAPRRIMGERGGKILKRVNGHYSVDGDLYYLWEDLDLCEADHEALAETLREIPYLGRECDLVLLDIVPENLETLLDAHRGTHTVLRPSPVGGVALRGLTPGLISWLDDRHESIFAEHAGQPVPVDHRIRQVRYAAATPLPDSMYLLVLPFSRAVSIDEARRRAATVQAGEGGFVFPVTQAGNPYLDGRAVGLGAITDRGIEVSEDFDQTWLGEDTGAASLQGGYWQRGAREWMSVVPFLGHPDRWVAQRQIEAAVPNATVLELDTRPVRPSQARMASDDTHRAWHAVLRTEKEIPGPLVLQRDTGTGVFLPDYGKDDRR